MTDSYGWNPLMHAVRNDSLDKVKQVLQRGVRPESRDVHGVTAVHVAAHRGVVSILNALVAIPVEGRPLHLRRDDRGRVPLIYAARAGNVGCVDALLALDVTGHREFVYEAMLLAIRWNLSRVVARLLTYPRPWSRDVRQVAMHATSHNSIESFRVFARAVIGSQSWRVITGAIEAAASAPIVQALIDAGAAVNVPPSCSDKPPVVAAVSYCNAPVVTTLALAGADMNVTYRESHRMLPATLAHLAIAQGQCTVFGQTAHMLRALMLAGCALHGAFEAAYLVPDPLRMKILHYLCVTLQRNPYTPTPHVSALESLATVAQGKHVHCVLSHAVGATEAKQQAMDDALVAACRQDNREAAVVLLEHGASATNATGKIEHIPDCLLARQLMWFGFDILSTRTPPWRAIERHRVKRRTLAAEQRLALARALHTIHWDNDVVRKIAGRLHTATLGVYNRVPMRSVRAHAMLGTQCPERLPGYHSTLRTIVEQVSLTPRVQSQSDCGDPCDWRFSQPPASVV